MTDLNKLTKAQLLALIAAAPDTTATQAAPVASLATVAIPDAAWEALEASLVTAYDSNSRDTTFLGAVLNLGKQIPTEWRGKQIPEAIADVHADNVKRKLYLSYGTPEQIAAMPKEQRDRIEKTCSQKHARAKALFTCAAILPEAYDQGFKGGVVEAGKLCTELKKAGYNLAVVLKARADAANAPTDYKAEFGALMDRLLNMKGEGDNVPTCLGAKCKAMLVEIADEFGVAVQHGNKYRNRPLAKG